MSLDYASVLLRIVRNKKNDASLQIDPVDRQPWHALTDVVELEEKLLETLSQMSVISSQKNIIHCNALAWLIVHSYIPRLLDYIVVNGESKLNFTPGDF